MGLFNHTTIGDIQSHVYLEGKILKVYLEDTAIAAAMWDTADVEYENKKIFNNAPIRYHCTGVGVERTNGAIVDGARGFDVDDKVILMAKIGSTAGKGEEYEKVYVVAHRDGIVPCTYNFLFLRVSASLLKTHAPPYGTWVEGAYVPTAPDSHLHEYCTVWDTKKGAPATVYNPVTKVPYVFPVTVEAFKPALDYFSFVDEELFTLDSQGDEQSQEAGFTPIWTEDIKGDKIRGGAVPSAWWTSYDIYADPIFKLLSDTALALFTDSAGAATGAFTNAVAKFDAGKENIATWKEASPKALNDDTRSFDVKGSDSTKEIPAATQARLQELQKLIGQMNDLIAKLTITYSAADTVNITRWKELAAKTERTPAEAAEYEIIKKSWVVLKYEAYGGEGRSASGMVARWDSLTSQVPLTDPVLQTEYVALSADPAIGLYMFYKGRRDTAQAEADSILAKGVFTSWEIAHDKDMKPLKGNSYHMQTAYGEDEIWVCGKQTYDGLVINACDAAWKFGRLTTLPPAIPIGNPAADRLAGNPWLGLGGMALGGVLSLSDVSMMLATDISQAGDGDIFSYGTLKRINDGGFHRTSHPALKTAGVGSWRMTQGKIPLAPAEPTFITALNTRLELIDVWDRYDNWIDSLQYSYASWGVDRTWWFKSNAEQWRIKAYFIDTPIGSMWYAAPAWEAALWYMSGINFSTGAITARRDLPVNTQFVRQTKHSKRIIAQIYIVQRQAVSMFESPTLSFVKQELNKGIYDHLVPLIPPETQPELTSLQAIVVEMTTLIKELDAVKIARWQVLKAEPVSLPAALQTELDVLETDRSVVNYQSYKTYLDTTQAQIDAITNPLEPIKYVSNPPGGASDDDYYTLTADQKKALVSDRVYLRTQYTGEVGYNPPAALRGNRNEVEIMAACDLYSALKTVSKECNPSKQVRNGLLEYEIQKLIAKYYTGEALGLKDFSEFKLEARIM